MFLTDARELGAREVAPDALLVKLPKKKRKIKNQTKRQKTERKALWTLAVTSQCRIIQLWVLRSTLTLKTTDTTLMSVDGAIGQKGVLSYTCHMTVPER